MAGNSVKHSKDSVKRTKQTKNEKTKFGKETGPRAAMIEFIGKIFTDESIETTEKEKLIELMKKSLKDLEKDTE